MSVSVRVCKSSLRHMPVHVFMLLSVYKPCIHICIAIYCRTLNELKREVHSKKALRDYAQTQAHEVCRRLIYIYTHICIRVYVCMYTLLCLESLYRPYGQSMQVVHLGDLRDYLTYAEDKQIQ